MPDASEFDALAAEFYEVWFHYHPELVRQPGARDPGLRSAAQAENDRAALRRWLEELLLGLDEINFAALDADRQLDWELMAGAARVEHRELADDAWRRLDALRRPRADRHPRDRLGCGADLLGLRLRERHFLDCDLDGDPAPGRAAIARALERAQRACTDPHGTPQRIADRTADGGREARLIAAGCGGHHPIAVTDPARARRLPRRLADDASLTLGLQLYLSHRLARAVPGGAGEVRPGRAAQRERPLLAQLDLDLHTGRIDGDQALMHLQEQGFTYAQAQARLLHLARHPGEAVAGILGWQLLEQARERLATAAGAGFVERDFHDRLVTQGAIPLPLVLRYGLGQTLWQAAYAGVLGTDAAGDGC